MYSEYVPTNERPVITALIQAILDLGYSISVSDGEETVIENSTNHAEIRSELGGTGEDLINFDSGYFYLIYNNGSEDDPMVVIADYSANDICDTIWNKLNEKLGEAVIEVIVTLRDSEEVIREILPNIAQAKGYIKEQLKWENTARVVCASLEIDEAGDFVTVAEAETATEMIWRTNMTQQYQVAHFTKPFVERLSVTDCTCEYDFFDAEDDALHFIGELLSRGIPAIGVTVLDDDTGAAIDTLDWRDILACSDFILSGAEEDINDD